MGANYPLDSIYCFDNGSAPPVSGDLAAQFPGINQARNELNSGYSGGFNQAMRWVFGLGFEEVFFLTNDTILFPQAAERCHEAAVRSNAGMIAPKIVCLRQPDKIDSIGAYFDAENATLQHYRSENLPVILNPQTDYIPGTAFWIGRTLFDALDGMDESYHTYWDDADFCFRAHRKGAILGREYQAIVGHGVGQTCHKKPLYTTFYFQRNRIRFFRKFQTGNDLEHSLELVGREIRALIDRWRETGDAQRLSYADLLLKELVSPDGSS